MLQVNLGAPGQFYPPLMPQATSRLPPSSIPGSGFTLSKTNCGYGYTNQNGVCMSQGCIDGRSPCVVVDGYGRTCSYDQLLAFQNKTGSPACGPAPTLPPPPQTPNVPMPQPGLPVVSAQQPGIVVDISPSPGTQATMTIPVAYKGIPRWAFVVGGLSVVAIIVALLVRR